PCEALEVKRSKTCRRLRQRLGRAARLEDASGGVVLHDAGGVVCGLQTEPAVAEQLYAKRCRQRESGQAVRALGEVHALSPDPRFRLAAGSSRELRHGDAFRRRGLVLVAEACRIFWLPARLLVARAAARYPGADEQAGCDARLVEDTERVA